MVCVAEQMQSGEVVEEMVQFRHAFGVTDGILREAAGPAADDGESRGGKGAEDLFQVVKGLGSDGFV